MVKLCDRITNLQPPPEKWDKYKIENYRDEALVIMITLGEASPFLAERLEAKVSGYGQWI